MRKGVFQSLFFVYEQMMWIEINYSSSPERWIGIQLGLKQPLTIIPDSSHYTENESVSQGSLERLKQDILLASFYLEDQWDKKQIKLSKPDKGTKFHMYGWAKITSVLFFYTERQTGPSFWMKFA